jgi:hypothetical protein
MAVTPLGCTKATVIGTACKADKDCNVKGQVCAPGFNGGPSICTRACTANTGAAGCPVGYDCFPTDTTKGLTCNKTLYEVDKNGDPLLFGVDCSASNDVCLNLGTSNAAPSCRRVSDGMRPPMPVDFDPNAYCTGTCAGDYDCPLDFYCGADYDMVTKCLRRTLCTPCSIDGNCGGNFPICIPTKDGKAHYCSKNCAGNGDCGGTANTALTCASTTTANGVATMACQHRFGACVGEGNICDPCRTDDDCMKSKSSCVINVGTFEGFCSKRCTTDASCMSLTGTVPAACDNTDMNFSLGICNGDLAHAQPGLLSCWLPQ